MSKIKYLVLLSLSLSTAALGAPGSSIPIQFLNQKPTFSSILNKIYNRQALREREWDNLMGYTLGTGFGLFCSYHWCKMGLNEGILPQAILFSGLVTTLFAQGCAKCNDMLSDDV